MNAAQVALKCTGAGAISALHGLKTLILEKNPRPGGSLSYYEKRGFQMDIGTHLFTRCNKGPFGACTRRLGMGTPIEFRHTKKTTWVRGLNLDAVMATDPIGAIWFVVQAAYQMRVPPLEIPNIVRLFSDILAMGEPEIAQWDGVSIDEFMRRYTDDINVRSLVGFLLGLYFILPTWEASAGESIWCLQRMFQDFNLGYPKGGAVAIPKAILKGAEAHGAQVRLKAGIEKIEIKDGKVQAVILKGGERITTRAVVSTTSLKDTVFKIVGEDYFPAEYVEKARKIKGSMIAVQAKIALKKPVTDVGSVVGGTPLKFDRNNSDEVLQRAFQKLEHGRIPEFVPIYAPIPTNYDPSLAPEGCQIVTACSVAPTLDVELQDPSSRWIDSMMGALYEMIPGLRENILFCDTFSVESIAGWIGKSSGAAVTTGQTPDQVGIRRPSQRTPIQGLYLAGDGAGARGVGTELACQSGMDCGDMVARDRANHLL